MQTSAGQIPENRSAASTSLSVESRHSGDRYSLFAEYHAYTSITSEEKAQIDAYISRCPLGKGAKVYYDPLYRGFYEDFSTITSDNQDACRLPDDVIPFIEPLALPPIIPARLVSIYEKLPPVMDKLPEGSRIEQATRSIEVNASCSVNRIATVEHNGNSIKISIVAQPMWRYLDKDPLLFLSEQDRTAVAKTLREGIPVTFELIEGCK